MIDAKTLKKLATACRKAGIKKYTSPEFSFELTDELPTRKSHKPSTDMSSNDDIKTETPMSDMDLLFWSAQDPLANSGDRQ